MDLTLIKNYLRIDDDLADDDIQLEELYNSAVGYLESTTGKQYTNENMLMNMLIKLLISSWYTNRNNNGKTTQTEEYPHSITALINTIKYNSSLKDIEQP